MFNILLKLFKELPFPAITLLVVVCASHGFYSSDAFATQENKKEETAPAEKLLQSEGESSLKKSPLENPDQKKNTAEEEKILAPWEEEKFDNELPNLRGITPRDLLASLDEGELEHLNDYNAFEPGDSTLIEILYRLQRFTKQDKATFAMRNMQTPLSMLSEKPNEQRLQIFSIAGRVKKLVKVNLVERIAELYQLTDKEGEPHDFEAYYQVHAELKPGGIKAIICCTSVPKQWLNSKEIDEPFSASAMFLKINSERSAPTELLFATDSVQWFPDTSNLDSTLEGGPLLLSRFGFDVNLLDDARARNRKSINKVDADCFYRMLAAANSIGESGKVDFEMPEMDVVELMNNPSPHHGDIFMIDADIRRVTRIEIDDPYHRDRLSITHYYQLDGFVDTDKIIKDPNLEKHGLPGYGKRYPVSICVAKLPSGMQMNSKQVYQVKMPVFYFKTWTFRSQLSQEQDHRLRHVAPLMIGFQPKLEPPPSYSSAFTATLLTTVSVFLFTFIWFGFWKQARDGKTTERSRFEVGAQEIDLEKESISPDEEKSGGEANDETIVDFPRLNT